MIKYKIRGSDWLTFALIIVNFNHFFIQPPPAVPPEIAVMAVMLMEMNRVIVAMMRMMHHVCIYSDIKRYLNPRCL